MEHQAYMWQKNNNMRIFESLVLIVLVLVSFETQAQRRGNSTKEKVEYLSTFDMQTLHWGFYMGFTYNDFNITYKEEGFLVESKPNLGFNVGLIGDLRLNNNLNLRLEPGLNYNSRILTFVDIHSTENIERNANGTYLHVPLLLQFSANRFHNLRPYVIGGASYDYNFSGGGTENTGDSDKLRLTKSNFMYEVGFGMDFYFHWFKFSPSIRGVFAINNEIIRDESESLGGYSQWTSPINYVGTRGIFLHFAFQ